MWGMNFYLSWSRSAIYAMTLPIVATMSERKERIPESYLAEIRQRVILSSLISSEIELSKSGSKLKAHCPFHTEKTPSFYVNDSAQYFHCFGCGIHGDGLTWVMKRRGYKFEEAVAYLAALVNLPALNESEEFQEKFRRDAEEYAKREVRRWEPNEDERERQSYARSIWKHSKPILGTVAEKYLRSRAITMREWPEALRFSENAWIIRRNKNGDNQWVQSGYPAMIAAIVDENDDVTAIQTTFLRSDGTGKADFEKPKRTTGLMGRGAIRLDFWSPAMGVAEGIETALSARLRYKMPIWCAAGGSRMASIWFPPDTRQVIVFGDNGESGHRLADTAVAAFHKRDIASYAIFPESDHKDENDALKADKAALNGRTDSATTVSHHLAHQMAREGSTAARLAH
ncbi:MAG: toprim domain-containing protein [Patescibacteria group bacterium]|nr:toprim domain-containing protein [Patescibacteria group bacterium]